MPGRALSVWMLAVGVVLVLSWLLGSVLTPFAVGLLVGFFLDPVCDWLERRGCSRGVAAALVIVTFLLAVVAAIAMLVPFVWEQAAELVASLPKTKADAVAVVEPYLSRLAPYLDDQTLAQVRETLSSSAGAIAQGLASVVRGAITGGVAVADIVSLAVLTPVVGYYMLREWDVIVAWIDDQMPRKSAPMVRRMAATVQGKLAAWLRGQAMLCLVLAVYYAIGLSAAGIRFGLLIGLMTGLVAFVPFVGYFLGLMAAVVSGLFSLNGWGGWAVVIGVFTCGQLLEGYVLTPRLVGRSVGLHEVWVIFAIMAGGHLLGFLGVLVAVPTAAVISVLIRESLAWYRTSAYYAGD